MKTVCDICNGTGEFINPFDQTFKCKCKEKINSKLEKQTGDIKLKIDKDILRKEFYDKWDELLNDDKIHLPKMRQKMCEWYLKKMIIT